MNIQDPGEINRRAKYAKVYLYLPADKRDPALDAEFKQILLEGTRFGCYNVSFETWLFERKAHRHLPGRTIFAIEWLFCAPGQPRPIDLGFNYHMYLEEIAAGDLKMRLFRMVHWVKLAIVRWKLSTDQAADVLLGLEKILRPKVTISSLTETEAEELWGHGRLGYWFDLALKLGFSGILTREKLEEWAEERAVILENTFVGPLLDMKLTELDDCVQGWRGTMSHAEFTTRTLLPKS